MQPNELKVVIKERYPKDSILFCIVKIIFLSTVWTHFFASFAIAKAKTTNRNKTFYLCTTCGSHVWMPGNGIILHVDCLIAAEYLSASFLALFSLYCSIFMFFLQTICKGLSIMY